MTDYYLKETPEGTWYNVPCAVNCGGRCLVKVLMKDGEYVRSKTDDTHPDSWDWPQARACPMGYTQWEKTFGPGRLKYPMKRKHWSPDEPHGELRGKDEWERISWDEALDIISSELTKAKEKYGNESILYLNICMLEGYLGAVLSEWGGYVDLSSVDSMGTFTYNTAMYGFQNLMVNDRYDNINSDYHILYGHNGGWAEFPSTYWLKPAHDAGVKFVFVGPEYNTTAAVFDSEWYPVRQGTDTAFLLGVAHSMITQDEDGSIIDWDFLNRCTVGFDADHMPDDAIWDENFHDYVMGKYDGIEKTPEWASKISGCSVEQIHKFARILGKDNKVSIHAGGAASRNVGAENLPQLLMTIGAMGGHYGKPGHACSNDQNYGSFDRGPKLAGNGGSGRAFVWSPQVLENPVQMNIPSNEVWDVVLNGTPFHDCGDSLVGMRACKEKTADIHVIISEQHNRLGSFEGAAKGIEAFRKVDFVCAQAYWMKTDVKYADVVLPVATRWERHMYNFYTGIGSTFRDFALINNRVLEPMYESKSDYDIAVLLAERLGVDWRKWLAEDEKQCWFNSIKDATVYVAPDEEIDESLLVDAGATTWMDTIDIMDDTSSEAEQVDRFRKLVTITQEDLDLLEVDGEPQQGVITLEQFLQDGVYRYKRDEAGYPGVFIAYEDFVRDPEKYPLGTASGKFEIYCQTKSNWFDVIHDGWPNYTPVSPLPKYLPTVRGYVEGFEDWENQIPGPYPYMISNSHTLRHSHTDHDNLSYLREAWANPIYISVKDAEEKGIKTGDIVRVFNDNGQILRQAQVSRFIMPTTLELPHGCAIELDEETGIDLAGNDNYLTSAAETTANGNNGWNSTRVNFEKYTGDLELKPDVEWEPRIPQLV